MSEVVPPLGAPGVYPVPSRLAPVLNPERLDVAGFVGVAPRGPIDRPVAVDSWSDYRRRFGDVEGPGLLPYAVHAFFAQGGARAKVLRVSPLPRTPDPVSLVAVARHAVRLGAPGGAGRTTIELAAADEGSWGQRLSMRWDFDVQVRFGTVRRDGLLELPDGARVPEGALIRLRGNGLPVAGSFVRASGRARQDRPAGTWVVPIAGAAAHGSPLAMEAAVIVSSVTVVDADPTLRREERFTGLGLTVAAPRFVAHVLAEESQLVRPGPGWPDELLPLDGLLDSVLSAPVPGALGADRWPGIAAGSFAGDVDPALLPEGGPEGLDDPNEVHGIDRMALDQEIGMLVVPDLLWASADAPADVVLPPAGRERGVFVPCAPPERPVVLRTAPVANLLDGRTQLDEIVARQRRVVAHAERQRRWVALLDVPQLLSARRIARWRSSFNSSFAAAYHPWLAVPRPGPPPVVTTPVPPSAFAAGIVAERELRLGLPWGPANEIAADAVRAVEPVTDAEHDALHLSGIDVFRAERDGFRLTSARTLASDPELRQLSVRRLMTMLRLVVMRQLQWMVFEPNSAALRDQVRDVVRQLLRQLWVGGALAGAREEEAFFVNCDDALNPRWSQDQGRLVAEIGVAPARPLEYLLLRVSQSATGALSVTEQR